MGDFHQNGIITILHNLSRQPAEELESQLNEFSKKRPLGLVLPSLFSELEGPALAHIVDELAKVTYLDQIVIGLDRATEDQYRHALKFFSRLPQHHRILWNDGPRLRAIDKKLATMELSPTEPGKGRNVWYCFGYVLASGMVDAVALHDCDILTYERSLLARLIYPVAHPDFTYKFCKGYYARFAESKVNGRVSRLLVSPLLSALKKICSSSESLDYLESFRYPLAGEFSMDTDVLEDLRMPTDWGLEVGILYEMKRNYSLNRICQVDIADTYDHKHQPLSLNDVDVGLSKMSIDIAKAIFKKLATEGEVFTSETFRTIKATYYRQALDFVEIYHNDALMNGLNLDRHKEEKAVELFAENILAAGNNFLEEPNITPFIPAWNRIKSAFTDIMDELKDAVEKDYEQYHP
ncbi:glycosyl transferase [Desulfobacter hydrogenophilus]|uniref:Glycosyl transferase n=1 Tax=Desulfobacter hydrogenophilus TaxID=2291 RepID=A0A328FFH3_9BACT|nr:glycosyl transferase [Desulfobacter hydrogenophilus]NDY72383.1 glycosyl transferase [Desulfobacter hydrogenophilus]QBH13109.1 glycosyl transferase [Desulfobacter hydrogenophilus]RAM01815.1 glycosyl transferase [Desulfobacter hydrogenophilus]